MHTLTVEALPGRLPNEIEHDVTALEIGDQVHVARPRRAAPVSIVTTTPTSSSPRSSLPRGLDRGEEAEAAEGEEGAEGEGGSRPLPAARQSGADGVADAVARRPPGGRARQSRRGVRRARGTTSAPKSSSCSRAGTAGGCKKSKEPRARRRGARRRQAARARGPDHVHERLRQAVAPLVAAVRRRARPARDRARRARPPARGAAREGRRRPRRPQRPAVDQAAPARRRVRARAHRRRQAAVEGAGRRPRARPRSASASASEMAVTIEEAADAVEMILDRRRRRRHEPLQRPPRLTALCCSATSG